MRKTDEKIRHFATLRAFGVSRDKISKILSVSKVTLGRWSILPVFIELFLRSGGVFSVKRCKSELKLIDPPDDRKEVTLKVSAYQAMNESDRQSARVLWEQRLKEASGDERRADSGSDIEITRIKVLYAVRAILKKCNGNLQEIRTLCEAMEKGEVPPSLLEMVGNATKDSDIGTLEFSRLLYAVRTILSECENLQEIRTLCVAMEEGEVPTERRLLRIVEIVGNATKDSDIGTLEFFKFLRKQTETDG